MINITFPDGNTKEFENEITGEKIALSISEGLARASMAIKVNDKLQDMTTPITENSKIQLLTFKDKEGKEVFWHSTAHVLAQAVTRLFPEAKPTIGPTIENGFYYDFDFRPFTPEDLPLIEKEMNKIIDERQAISKEEISKQNALKIFENNEFKKELIEEYSDSKLTIYKQGEYVDLCRGPHIINTSKIKAFKLTKISGAYWRADANNKQLSRIYGVSYTDKKDLNEYLRLLEEAEKRNHIKLGKEHGLFSFHEEGPGFPFFKPKGMIIWNELLNYWHEVHDKWNYKEIKTPIMLNKMLWEKSGHWTNYRENMYTTKIDEVDFAIKPMNCPGGMLVYNEEIHSYRELPFRCGEIGLVHRHELSGALNGLFRVRCFHQDDAHIYMTEEQIKSEILGVLKLADEMYSTFGLSYHLELSTRPVKSIGTDEAWKIATEGLKSALDSTGREYKINEGDGAFYGPKIDIHIKDALGRTWQCGTIQLDMNNPERFDLTYEGEDGKKHRPIMIHRVIYGSMERFFGILTEHFAARFPLWLSPVQVKLLPIADRHIEYAKLVSEKLRSSKIRVAIDNRSETINKKVRDAQIEQVNYILVIGDKEVEANTVNIRTRDNRVVGAKDIDEFEKKISEEITKRLLTPVL
ncbi:MAG: threonine--tRNA ligase [Candidatus Woesearchaeota archaeon]|jgi:threonyl-tRNA synthetase